MANWLLAWLLLIAMNGAAFAAFGVDKRRALEGRWRVRERDLLLLALLGGVAGAWLGRWYFRHKTRKLSFSVALYAITALQGAILLSLVTRP